jgi:hypothetical protein
LLVEGQFDFDALVAHNTWRLIKSGVVDLWFGYLTTGKSPRPGGGRYLSENDLYEVSVTPATCASQN